MKGRLTRLFAAFALLLAPVLQLCPAQALAMPAAGCEHCQSEDRDWPMAPVNCTIGCAALVATESDFAISHEPLADPFVLAVKDGNGHLGEVATPPPK